ncbi:MAG TPA: hypothetical protein VL856_11055 [Acidimicrobiia bacterium]|jgi:hypothetical protein|nr:hypothetical protein [Acidimicrobiia bacterium]
MVDSNKRASGMSQRCAIDRVGALRMKRSGERCVYYTANGMPAASDAPFVMPGTSIASVAGDRADARSDR